MNKSSWQDFFRNPSFWLCSLTIVAMLAVVKLVINVHPGGDKAFGVEGALDSDKGVLRRREEIAPHMKFRTMAIQEFAREENANTSNFCDALLHLIRGKNVLELEAGGGPFGHCFLKSFDPSWKKPEVRSIGKLITPNRQSWTGYSNSASISEETNGLVGHIDLIQPQDFNGTKWDWVINLNIPEQLPQKLEDTYFSNAALPAKEGIILSWRNSRNTHSNGIMSLLLKLGWLPDLEDTFALRQSAEHLKNTIVVFRPLKCSSESASWWSYFLSFFDYTNCR